MSASQCMAGASVLQASWNRVPGVPLAVVDADDGGRGSPPVLFSAWIGTDGIPRGVEGWRHGFLRPATVPFM